MTLLRDFQAIRLRSEFRETACGDSGFAWAREMHENELVDILASVEGHVLVIEPDVNVDASAEILDVDPVLLEHHTCVGYPSVNSATGLYVSSGISIVSKEGLLDRDAQVLVPHSVGKLIALDTPEQAFSRAFDLMRMPSTSGSRPSDRALAASLGADCNNGNWWILGSLLGLLGEWSRKEAWLKNQPLLNTPEEMTRSISVLADRAALEKNVPARVINSQQSSAIKQVISEFAPSDMWRGFIRACEALGPDAAKLAFTYRSTGARIWSDIH